jgi:hypothetical protein
MIASRAAGIAPNPSLVTLVRKGASIGANATILPVSRLANAR